MLYYVIRNFKIPNREQKLLFADVDLNTIASIGSPLYIIDRLVEELDTTIVI